MTVYCEAQLVKLVTLDRRAMVHKSYLLALTLGFAALLFGCQTWQQTNGEVSVGRPQVYGRERLQNERLGEVNWLREQLERPVESGYQGVRDTREAAAYVFGLTVQLDFAQKRLQTLEREDNSKDRGRTDELAAIRHDITKTQLEQQLNKLKTEQTSVPDAPPAAVPDALKTDLTNIANELKAITARLDSIEKKAKPAESKPTGKSLLEDGKSRLADPGDAKTSSAVATTRDRFEDEAAFRDLVNARIREKILDDTHDLAGFALYELKFDASIVPGINSSRKFVAALTLLPDENVFPEKYVNDAFIERLVFRIQEDANVLAVRLHERLEKDKLSQQWRNRVLALDHLEIQNAYARCFDPGQSGTIFPKALSQALQQALRSGVPPGWGTQAFVGSGNAVIKLIDEGRCLQSAYVKKRLSLVLDRYFKFDIVSMRTADGNSIPYITVEKNREEKKCHQFDRATGKWNEEENCSLKDRLVARLIDIEKRQSPWVATVEPKEYAQNISEVSSLRRIRQISAAVGAKDGTARDAQATADIYKEDQDLLQAIRRQPLAASFVRGEHQFGWILGPKFEIQNNRPVFVHSVARYTFSASVVVPGWFGSVKLSGCGYWINDLGERSDMTPLFGDTCLSKISVNLPASHRPLMHALMGTAQQDVFFDPEIYLLPQAGPSGVVRLREAPASCTSTADKSCEQSLVIEGRELWRNPSVFLGNRKADRIELLPSMRGIVAYFRGLDLPPTSAGMPSVAQDLFISTSTGQDRLAKAVQIVPAEQSIPVPFVRLEANIIEKTQAPTAISFIFAPAALPRAYADIRATVRRVGEKGAGKALPGVPEITLGRIRYTVADLETIGLGGQAQDLEFDVQLQLSPNDEWLSIMQPDGRFATYLSNANQRELTIRAALTADLSKLTKPEHQATKLREALTFGLPADAALYFKVYAGLERALDGRGGEVQIRLALDDGDEIAIRAIQGRNKAGLPILLPEPVSVRAKLSDIVPPPGETQVPLAVTVAYRVGSSRWTTLALDNKPILTVIPSAKPPATAPSSKDAAPTPPN